MFFSRSFYFVFLLVISCELTKSTITSIKTNGNFRGLYASFYVYFLIRMCMFFSVRKRIFVFIGTFPYPLHFS